MWRKIFKHLFGTQVAVTTDIDGNMRWRFVCHDPRGGYRVRAIMGWVRLNEDGTCNTPAHSYVAKWQMI